MNTCYDVIKSIARTEKGVSLEPQRKYVFRVASVASKIDISRAVQEIYKVKVQDVNVMTVRGKKKRVRKEYGYTTSWKKAIVTLKVGEKIEVA
jgi:large subunit ribosomal protein L23